MSDADLSRRLLDLPDDVLSRVLQHVSVADKQQHVQQCCMRLRRLLQRSVAPGVWGSIGVRLRRDKVNTIAQLKALLQWLTLRQAGITEVRVYVDTDFWMGRGLGMQTVLYALAGALAPTQKPLRALYSLDLDMGKLPPLAKPVLAATLQEMTLVCSEFEMQHWVPLCSLSSLRKAVLKLQRLAPLPVQQPPFTIQNMQLTSMEYLQFTSTSVEVAAPLLAHASALTSLATLYFLDCSLGTLPAGVLQLPQLATLGMYNCELTQLLSLEPLNNLVELHLPNNPRLVDLRPALGARHQLARLVLQGTTPQTEATLEALQGLSRLKILDVSKHSWSVQDAAALGSLVQLAHEKGCKLIA